MKKLLIIEDDPDIAEMVEMALSEKYTILTKKNGYELTEVLAKFAPDLILVDNYICQKQASEIVAEIRGIEKYREMPFILFSGHHNIQKIAAEIRAAAFLPKPFDLDDLHNCIEKVLQDN